MKISVIVPVYNAEKFLNQCLESIINQTFKDFELLLIDDGSTDSSGRICDEYAEKDSRIKVVHQRNQGQAVARNKGLDMACGEWIAMIDSDDYIKTDMFEKLLTAAEKENADMCSCNFFSFDNETPEILKEHTYGYTEYRISSGLEILKEANNFSDLPSKFTVPWSRLVKKEAYDSIRFPEGIVFEDAAIAHLVLDKCKKIVLIPDCLYYYRIVQGSTTHREFNIKFFDVFYSQKARFDYYVKHGIEEYSHSLQDSFYAYLLSDYYRYSGDKENRKKLLEFRKMALQIFPYYFKRKDVVFNQKLSILLFCLSPGLFKIIFRR